MQEQEFRAQAKADGYDEPIEKTWEANLKLDMHTHDFSAMLYILEGEFIIVREDSRTSYGPGEHCQLDAGIRHTETTGDSGARGLVSRKHA